MTYEQLAVELGTAREVISRSLKDFAKKKIILLRRSQIQILDRTPLFQILDNH
ncbi:helix-turn-helix domain-containing protein [Brevibacillus daliensis]|uniref:helix-turn-helix domain-containing protein n=1 Tax=Brevibacillus daliensis TaxID=2892995 RepID=UPI002814A884|nr:helix-turn-helix domain-containing protein [Brevibacillus daliensis]